MKSLRYFTFLSLSLLVPSLIVTAPAQAVPSRLKNQSPTKISLKFKVPGRGAPPSTAGGATRGFCASSRKEITPLVPKTKVGLTFASHPSFFLYLPESPARSVELLLLSEDDTQVIYQTTFPLPPTAGVMRFDLPKDAPALEVGKRYHWYLTVNCDPNRGPSGNPSVEGWVERTQPELALTKALAKANLSTHPELYAEAGIWHETLTALVDLRQKNPDNSKILSDWRELLESVGLNAIASEPVVDCCTARN